jgi:hypothetical protein
MAIDPTKPRKVLVIHGVQTESDADLHQDQAIDTLIRSRLGNIPFAFNCELYRYENLNDQAQKAFKLLNELMNKNPIGQPLGDKVIDIVGDVVISLTDNSTANMIRSNLKEKILDIYQNGNPCYLVAHSLGSIYAFDVLNELIAEHRYFDRSSRKTWPVQGLMTIGSPIGLDLFRITGRDKIQNLGAGGKWLRWLNIYDHNDPVVSGNIFGKYLSQYKIAESFLKPDPNQGWVIRDIAADTGKAWLLAHTAYWQSPIVGDKLVDMVSS